MTLPMAFGEVPAATLGGLPMACDSDQCCPICGPFCYSTVTGKKISDCCYRFTASLTFDPNFGTPPSSLCNVLKWEWFRIELDDLGGPKKLIHTGQTFLYCTKRVKRTTPLPPGEKCFYLLVIATIEVPPNPSTPEGCTYESTAAYGTFCPLQCFGETQCSCPPTGGVNPPPFRRFVDLSGYPSWVNIFSVGNQVSFFGTDPGGGFKEFRYEGYEDPLGIVLCEHTTNFLPNPNGGSKERYTIFYKAEDYSKVNGSYEMVYNPNNSTYTPAQAPFYLYSYSTKTIESLPGLTRYKIVFDVKTISSSPVDGQLSPNGNNQCDPRTTPLHVDVVNFRAPIFDGGVLGVTTFVGGTWEAGECFPERGIRTMDVPIAPKTLVEVGWTIGGGTSYGYTGCPPQRPPFHLVGVVRQEYTG